ncbi:hypothetical protein [Lysinibacillus sp. FSL W8-0992]|uniref:hypothetical protein n=1 Tax=Lysinibacillus sp. FSL W8-0992 TaxID=2954643 RepID=UPI0030F81585
MNMSISKLVVNDFLRKKFSKSQINVLLFYAQFWKDPIEICRLVGWAIGPDKKTQCHQKRITLEAKGKLEKHLLSIYHQIPTLKDFEELMKLIRIKGIKGIGGLTVYDTAERIGYAFGLYPTKVYLHRGTRTGAINLLGRKAVRGRKYLYMHEFPVEFQILTPREMENCLCIYKDTFLTGKLPKQKLACNGKMIEMKNAC